VPRRREEAREAEDCKRDRVGPSSWKSHKDAGEPTSRPLPFSSSSLPSHLFPLFAILCRPFVVLLLPMAAFALPLILFVLSIGRRSSRPALRPLRIIRVPFFSFHSVLLYSFPFHAVSFCLSSPLPIAMILSMLLPQLLSICFICVTICELLFFPFLFHILSFYFISFQ